MQVEENKRKLEELGLHHLSAAVKLSQSKPLKQKPRAQRASAAAVDAPLRRSRCVSSLPEQPNYRGMGRDFKKIGVDATGAERSYALAKAKELEGELGASHPAFLRPMSQSDVTSNLRMRFPVQFCQKYLPKHDKMITLVDEEDVEFDTQYRGWHNEKGYLVAGWKGFAIDHKLVDGDCLVFQLIQPTKFKVTRSYNPAVKGLKAYVHDQDP